MSRLILLALGVVSTSLAFTSPAAGQPLGAHATDGLYSGRERAPRGPGPQVSIEIREGALVLIEATRVLVGTLALKPEARPNDAGAHHFEGSWRRYGGILRSGQPAGTRRHTGLAALALSEDRATLCLSEGAYRGATLSIPVGARPPGPGARCFDLTRAPLPGPPIPTPESTFTRCFKRCVEDNRARASNAATLDNECERQCRQAPTTPGALKRP